MSVLKAQCHCGAVTIEIAHKPEYINDCNCSLCASTGAIWGYFSGSEIKIIGPRASYVRKDYELPAVELHFCPECGATTDWSVTEQYQAERGPLDRCGVNMRLFDRAQLDGVEVRFPDGWTWDGSTAHVPRRDPIILGRDAY